jgi:hypothetical protein
MTLRRPCAHPRRHTGDDRFRTESRLSKRE